MDVTALGGAPDVRAKVERSARDFEAVFAGQIAKLMLESADVGEFGGGHGEEMFRGVLAEKIGEQMAAGASLGIAPAVMGQILRMQEQAK